MKRLRTIRIKRPCDFHTHLRSPAQVGERCFRMLVRANCRHYRYVIVEPNTFLDASKPGHHIETADDMVKYRTMVFNALQENSPCTPLFLIKLTPRTTPSMISEAAEAGCIGLKLYPEGVTVGSEHGGVLNFTSRQICRCLERAQEENLVLQEHPEFPGMFCLNREYSYGHILRHHAKEFPKLRIFVEHITDRRTIELVHDLRQSGALVFGTITGHHLEITLDNVLGQVNHHCWPCAKYPEDRARLRETALSGSPYFLSITDSAPHKWRTKHPLDGGCGCAGVFNPAEIAIPHLVQLFETANRLDTLEAFTSGNGLAAYRIANQDENDTITLVRQPWQVPRRYDSGGGTVTPFKAGKPLQWQIVNS